MSVKKTYALLLVILAPALSGCGQVPGLPFGEPNEVRQARTRLLEGDPEGAARALENLIQSNPKEPTVYILAAQTVLQADRPNEALRYVERGLNETQGAPAEKHAQLYALKGEAYLRLQKPADAVEAMRASLRLAPDEPVFMNNLAYALAEDGDRNNLEEAIELATKALEKARQAGAAPEVLGVFVDTLGWSQFQMGQLQAALVNLTTAAYLAPEQAEVLYHLGRAYAEAGRRDEAICVLRRALKTRPSMRQARQLLSALEASMGQSKEGEQQ